MMWQQPNILPLVVCVVAVVLQCVVFCVVCVRLTAAVVVAVFMLDADAAVLAVVCPRRIPK